MTEERLAEERLSRARFIRLGAALGVGGASASMIAACGGGESGGGGGGEKTGAGATQASGEKTGAGETEGYQAGGAGGDAIAQEAEVAPGSAVNFTDESGQPAVLVHLENGDFAAYSAVCTHQRCTVAYRGGQLACPCHGSVFDPENGAAVVNGPAQTPLTEIPVEVRDGQVVRA